MKGIKSQNKINAQKSLRIQSSGFTYDTHGSITMNLQLMSNKSKSKQKSEKYCKPIAVDLLRKALKNYSKILKNS